MSLSKLQRSLTPAETERLVLVAEECGEVVQAVGKILRHGWVSKKTRFIKGYNNHDGLMREVADLYAVLRLLYESDLDAETIFKYCRDKRKRLRQYTHHQDAYWAEHKPAKSGVHGRRNGNRTRRVSARR